FPTRRSSDLTPPPASVSADGRGGSQARWQAPSVDHFGRDVVDVVVVEGGPVVGAFEVDEDVPRAASFRDVEEAGHLCPIAMPHGGVGDPVERLVLPEAR